LFVLFYKIIYNAKTMRATSIPRNVFRFYYEGFKSMTIGKTLWIIILIKLFIMFVIFRQIFFKNFLNSNFETQEEKSSYVIEQLTQ
jgi:hypothetical protein